MWVPRPRLPLLLIALALSGCQPQAPVVRFNLDHHWVTQPVLRLDDGRRLDGLAAFVIEDVRASAPVVVAPLEVWMPRVAPMDLSRHMERVEIYGLDGPGALLGTSTQTYGTVGGGPQGEDYSQGVVLFLLDGGVDRAVHTLQLESSPPAEGDVFWVIGCRDEAAPCEQDTHAVEIVRVTSGTLRGQPLEYDEFHATAGAPLVTPAGNVVGMLARRAGPDSPDLLFVPASAIRARLDTASRP